MNQDQVIMVLDDEPSVTRMCRTALEQAGFEVLEARDARKAVGALDSARVDLLLVDIQMPHMDGFQVMEKARALQPEMAILIMTGYGTMETATRALRMGANGLILKPFESNDELIREVKKALAERENRRESSRLQALRPLLKITNELFKSDNREMLVDVILDAITGLLASPHAGVYRRVQQPDRTQFLQLVAQRENPLPGEPVGFGGGPVSTADAWGTPSRAGPGVVEQEEHFEMISAHGLGAVLCAPAVRGTENNNIVLLAARGPEGPAYTDADAELFALLANQAGIALENARLYAELDESYRQLQEQQKALLQTEKMAAIGRLTASIAHEVNNPLQAVRNCLHLVTRDDLDLSKRGEYLRLAQDEMQRLMDTVQQMLDFYRPSTLVRELVDINALIQTVLSLLAKQFQESEVRIETRLAKGLPFMFLVRNQIQQVFFNVLLNAMEAMPGGGTIYLQTEQVGDSVVILVEDTGPGVPEETRTRLFEPFVSSKPQGTGLGLSVSYSIIDTHGGTIELLQKGVARPSGGGASFRITLPIVEAE